MIRHPIYLFLCVFAVGYLAVGDVRGWSLLHSLSQNLVNMTSSGRGPSGHFNHK
jgi:protein-S-isoprenylcysteine O-methyltransferase Ste14